MCITHLSFDAYIITFYFCNLNLYLIFLREGEVFECIGDPDILLLSKKSFYVKQC